MAADGTLSKHALQGQQAAHEYICSIEGPPGPPDQRHLTLLEAGLLQHVVQVDMSFQHDRVGGN